MIKNKSVPTLIVHKILDSAVVVRCHDTIYGIILLIFLKAEKQLEVSSQFKEVNLSTSVPKNKYAMAEYVSNNGFEYIIDLFRKLSDKFEIAKKLNINKQELGLFVIQTQTKINNQQDIDKLTLKLAKTAKSESLQISTIIDNKVIDCIAYSR